MGLESAMSRAECSAAILLTFSLCACHTQTRPGSSDAGGSDVADSGPDSGPDASTAVFEADEFLPDQVPGWHLTLSDPLISDRLAIMVRFL